MNRIEWQCEYNKLRYVLFLVRDTGFNTDNYLHWATLAYKRIKLLERATQRNTQRERS